LSPVVGTFVEHLRAYVNSEESGIAQPKKRA
jgi:hypothetical protein